MLIFWSSGEGREERKAGREEGLGTRRLEAFVKRVFGSVRLGKKKPNDRLFLRLVFGCTSSDFLQRKVRYAAFFNLVIRQDLLRSLIQIRELILLNFTKLLQADICIFRTNVRRNSCLGILQKQKEYSA